MKKYKYIWTVKSECGPVRKKNEDSIFPLESGSSRTSVKACLLYTSDAADE